MDLLQMPTANSLIKTVLLCALTYCLSHQAYAKVDTPSKNTSLKSNEQQEISHYFYLGAELGLNHYQHGCEAWSISCDKDDLGVALFAGYQINTNFAFEATYLDLGDAQANYDEAGTVQQYTGTMKGLTLSGLGILPLTDNIAIFGKLGTFNWYGSNTGPYHKTKSDGWSLATGLGLTYQLSDAWQTRVEYQYLPNIGDNTIGGSNAHFTSIGISYQFGRTKPKIVRQVVIQKAPIILEEITFALLFDFDKTNIVQPEALKLVVTRLTKYPQAKVILRGYSDTKGSDKYNLTLANRRVDAVSDYLIKQGVNANQISSEAFGEAAPVIDNNKEEHRHLNRHVQIQLLQAIITPAQEQ
jgi:OOP family OmpA-OmpF porin